MALLDALGSIAESAGIGTLATTIFLSRMPDTPDACVTIVESGSGNTIYMMKTVSGSLYQTNVQVMARGVREDYPNTRTKIDDTITAFETVNEQVISGFRVLRIEQIGRPVSVGYDENERPKVAMNFRVTHA
jgi:hypothetical protein